MRDETKELIRALRPPQPLLYLPFLEVLERRGEERLGYEGVLGGVGVGLGKVVEGADGHAGVLFEDAAEAAEEAEAEDEGGGKEP